MKNVCRGGHSRGLSESQLAVFLNRFYIPWCLMCETGSYLSFLSASSRHRVAIEDDFADELISAKDWIFYATSFEQRFDILLENFADVEGTILELALRDRVFPGTSEHSLSEGRHLFNRRLLNFLSSWTLYIHQTRHALSTAFGGDSSCFTLFSDRCSSEYDDRLGYRFVEALRNHTQHRALPTHAIRIGGSSDGALGSGSEVTHRVVFSIRPANFAQDGGFKQTVLTELMANADKSGLVPILPLVQDAMTGLCAIHSEMRSQLESCFRKAEGSIQEMFSRALEEAEGGVGLVFVVRKKIGADLREVGIAKHMLDPWKAYLKKNRHSGQLSRRSVALR